MRTTGLIAIGMLAPALAGPVAAGQQLIPVPASVIYAGQSMEEAALVEKLFNVPDKSTGNYVLDRSQLKGLFAKRALLPGKPIAVSHLKSREVASQGTPTRATYSADGLTITTLLVPLQAGAVGEVIDARNPQTGLVVKARVAENGTLVIGP